MRPVKPYIWRGKRWKRWYVDRDRTDREAAHGTSANGYATWAEALAAALVVIRTTDRS